MVVQEENVRISKSWETDEDSFRNEASKTFASN